MYENCNLFKTTYPEIHCTTKRPEKKIHAVFTRKHIFVLLNTQEKSWKVATDDFLLFILFGIRKKFSFPTFFWLRYSELVAGQLRVFAGCIHTNYIA